jgi:hypothetical protein
MLVGSDKLFSDKEFPIKNVDQSLIKHIFEEVPVTEAQIRKLVDQKKHVEHKPTKHMNQKNRFGKNQKGPKINELKPIKSKGTDQMRHSLQNHQRIFSPRSSDYDSYPSTSRFRSSQGSCSPRFSQVSSRQSRYEP